MGEAIEARVTVDTENNMPDHMVTANQSQWIFLELRVPFEGREGVGHCGMETSAALG